MEIPFGARLAELFDQAVDRAATAAVDTIEWLELRAAISPRRAARRGFHSYGAGTAIQRPWRVLMGEKYIALGSASLVGPGSILAAMPYPEDPADPVISIGDRTWLGRGTGLVAHRGVHIGDDVWFGPDVYVTDANHGYEDITRPVGLQMDPPRPVHIGSGSWIGTGAVVLPGVTIGEHVAIGANAVVNRDIPPFSVAVGNPARVIRTYEPTEGWVEPGTAGAPSP